MSHDHRHPHSHPHSHPHTHPHSSHGHSHDSVDRRTILRWGSVGFGAVLLAGCGSGDTALDDTTASTNSSTATASDSTTSEPPPTTSGAAASESVAAGETTLPGFDNCGDDAFLAGELDEFGGHCGRADDYHYHIAPLHLEEQLGPEKPIAYALDGFEIYGSAEPDGRPLTALDEYNGHIGEDGVYHYHGTTTYPYINGGLVGVVNVSDQVDPQPSTPAIRPAGEPLGGATITGFDTMGGGAYQLEYTLDNQIGIVSYQVSDTSVAFEFTSPTGALTTETYER